MSSVSVYGNAPSGEYSALLRTTSPQKYPEGFRYIVGFLLTTEDGKEPLLGDDGHLWAIAVCNLVKTGNAKSKQFKIRKAMLSSEEYDPIEAATNVPDFDHFITARRLVRVRVERRPIPKGGFVSVVTHIQRPRDGEWESIEGEYDGPPYPWINADGTKKELKEAQFVALPLVQRRMHTWWDQAMTKGKPWVGPDGSFLPLGPEDQLKLDSDDAAKYRAAQIQAKLRARQQKQAA